MSDQWMTCTSCRAIVQLNATGTCLGCQGGFGCQSKEDRYLPIETKLKSKEEEISRLKEREKELEDALKKRKEPEGDKLQHKDGDGVRKEPKAKRSNSPKRGRKKKETKKEEEIV